MQHYKLPPKIKQVLPKQIEAVNTLAPKASSGVYLDMGTGKTLVSTLISLYYKITEGRVVVVIMPPILLGQWEAWLTSITPALKVVTFRGTPKQRAAMSFEGADCILVGIQIFKKEYQRFVRELGPLKLAVPVDEATFIANVGTDAHDKVYDFTSGQVRMMLTGTPANKPGDAYGLIKFVAPGTYRSQRQFENLHVEERDFWGNPCKWRDLDVLHRNLLINSVRVLYEDMFSGTEPPLFDPVEYDLEPDHYKLYRKLAEEELLKLPDGGKIDATSANKLTHALGQIIINYDYFSGDPSKGSAGIDLIEQKLLELGEGKLVVFANYRMTIASICRRLAKYGAVAINSEVSAAQKDRNLQRFVTDPSCRLIVIQFVSGGKGLDGLQHVCHHAMFIEPCQQPRDFHQAVARLARLGQAWRVTVWMAVARRTLQPRAFRNLLVNDGIVNQVVRNAYDLRALIYGE